MSTFIGKAIAEETVATATDMAEEAGQSWASIAFEKMAEVPVWGYVLLGVLLVAGIIALAAGRKKKINWNTRMIAMGAMCLALSAILSRICLYRMPQGGSITLASKLPLILFSFIYGPGPGFLVGALYGVMDYMFGGFFLSVPQFLLDYPIASAMCGFAGFFGKMKKGSTHLNLSLAVVVSCVFCYLANVLSGVFFFSDYAPAGMNPWVYSFGYNATYAAPECAICVVVALLVGARLARELRKYK